MSTGLSIADRLLLAELREKFPDLQRRVESLEAVRKPLLERAAALHAAGEVLYAEVRAIVEQHQGQDRLTAKHVLPKLTREPKPSLRQVQDLLKRARAESSVPRL